MPENTQKNLFIQEKHIQEMRRQVGEGFPEEVCGMIGGTLTDGNHYRAEKVYPVTNRLHSPTRYAMEPEEQLQGFLSFESQGLELVATYHSHPNGPAYPSQTDVQEFYYPGTLCIIWALEKSAWQVNAYTIEGSEFHPVCLVVG